VGIDRRLAPARVAAVVSQLEADVVGLQEVDSTPASRGGVDQLREIARASGFASVRGPTVAGGDGQYGNGILTRLPVANARLIDLSVDAFEPRGAIEIEIDHAGVRIRVVATHLGLMPHERRAQLDRLLERLEPPSHFDLSVLLGDFNEWWARGEQAARLHRYFGRTRSVRSFPAPVPVLALDRIWVKPAGAVREFRAHRSRLARVASDHLPVRAVVDLPEPKHREE
jgi:endonuclease/exonuclease/phosphatase family metal-dependent hydrolase